MLLGSTTAVVAGQAGETPDDTAPNISVIHEVPHPATKFHSASTSAWAMLYIFYYRYVIERAIRPFVCHVQARNVCANPSSCTSLTATRAELFLSVAELSQMESLLCTVGCTNTNGFSAGRRLGSTHATHTFVFFSGWPKLGCPSSGQESHGRTTAIWDVSLARTPQPILDLTLPKFLWFSPSRRLLLAPSRELLPCRPPALSKLCGTCFCSRGCSWRILRRAP